MTQASEEEAARRLSQLSEALHDVSTYLWKEQTPLLMSAEQCVLQDDKVVLMDIPVPVKSQRQRVMNDRVVTDVEISLGDRRTRAISIEMYDSNDC
ncbi:hypothetical protein PILCRDRAFT_636844 [Piloderma croceum F 1598]|uniref:Uncharacterized protein n=1 Tax=Piloderma croceum (strain F 1598) TaxID=765440 RepID=A0A0C3AS80_PILCF|nr:hypothetical protein PILCRDRAFT_636844 [Piloderma croceum F 1598]